MAPLTLRIKVNAGILALSMRFSALPAPYRRRLPGKMPLDSWSNGAGIGRLWGQDCDSRPAGYTLAKI